MPRYLAILETGVPPLGLDETYGDYPQMFCESLGLKPESVRVFKTMDGDLPIMDEELSGVLITGSPAGVYEDIPWISMLIDWLQKLDTHIPVLGICFGHQVMAQAYGGHVEKSDKGWGVGLHDYHVYEPDLWQALSIKPAPEVIKVAATHQDQVVKCPPQSKVIAGSDFTPIGGLYYTHRQALSFQCHPEFNTDYAKALLISRRGTRIGAELVDQAVISLDQASSRHMVLELMAQFLARPVTATSQQVA